MISYLPEVVQQWGADTIRLFILFKAPASQVTRRVWLVIDDCTVEVYMRQVLEWDTKAIQGQHRWLSRVWEMVGDCAGGSYTASAQAAS